MTGWRMELTVLTDLSASIFAVCFTVLLVFIGLAERDRNTPQRAATQAIEASTELRTVRRRPLGPAGMIDLLFHHGHPGAAERSLDLFADRVELRAGGRRTILDRDAVREALPGLLRAGPDQPVRLYVLASDRYGDVLAALARGGAPFVEMSIPGGLRDPAHPLAGWSPAFLAFDAAPLDLAGFRERLAVLLAGSAASPPRAPAGSTATGAFSGTTAAASPGFTAPFESLTERWDAWLRRFALLLPLAGLAAAVLIRHRHPDVTSGTFDESADLLTFRPSNRSEARTRG